MSIPFAVSIVEADAMCGREENAPQQRNEKSLHVVSGAQQKPTHQPVYNKAFGFAGLLPCLYNFRLARDCVSTWVHGFSFADHWH